jgi:aspartyl-tRNA(Asn)/glutamyl-tRNA(Gln) amidotransferase subunit A
MANKDITMMSVDQVSKMVQSGEVTSVQLVEACLARIESLNPQLNAFVYLAKDQALAAAAKADAEIKAGNYKGPLHGIPIALKDLFYTKGIPTTASSEVLRDFVPDFNGTVVQRLEDAGAILMGKTNTHEFAFGPTTEESCFGPSRNPWNPKKITGGSSGGSAVAAATGMAYVTMGSDTGGSVRIPSAMCGTVGFKPSYGLASLYGIIALSFSLDHPGPLCRSVVDCAIAMDAITGTDPKDPCPAAVIGEPTQFYKGLEGVTDLKGKVFGIPKNFFFDKTDYEVERVFNEAVENLKKIGAEIKYVEIPALELVTEASTRIMFSEAAYIHRDWYPARKSVYQAGVAARLDMGLAFTGVQYIQALKDREVIMAEWEKTLEEFDAILTPTLPIEAFDIGLGDPWTITTRGKSEPGKAMAIYHTRLGNMTGAPAITLPVGLTKNNLPVGLAINGARNDDLNVLRLALAYEKNFSYPTLSY